MDTPLYCLLAFCVYGNAAIHNWHGSAHSSGKQRLCYELGSGYFSRLSARACPVIPIYFCMALEPTFFSI